MSLSHALTAGFMKRHKVVWPVWAVMIGIQGIHHVRFALTTGQGVTFFVSDFTTSMTRLQLNWSWWKSRQQFITILCLKIWHCGCGNCMCSQKRELGKVTNEMPQNTTFALDTWLWNRLETINWSTSQKVKWTHAKELYITHILS
jgi:hypothetical protein